MHDFAGYRSLDDLVLGLEMIPHPEGGCYRETLRVPSPDGGRALSTAIYYLLRSGERSHWHRVDAVETWHFYAGAPLALGIHADGRTHTHTLGPGLGVGQSPQITVPQHGWQSAWSLGEWTLVGCTVSPGFEFAGFELAPPGWEPPQG